MTWDKTNFNHKVIAKEHPRRTPINMLPGNDKPYDARLDYRDSHTCGLMNSPNIERWRKLASYHLAKVDGNDATFYFFGVECLICHSHRIFPGEQSVKMPLTASMVKRDGFGKQATNAGLMGNLTWRCWLTLRAAGDGWKSRQVRRMRAISRREAVKRWRWLSGREALPSDRNGNQGTLV